MIASEKSDKETRDQEQGESAKKKHSSNKSPLLADGGENVVVMHGSGGEESKLNLRIWRFEALA